MVYEIPKLGTVYPYKARLFDKDHNEIGYCIDTPNAIANAISQTNASFVKPYLESVKPSEIYKNRIGKWNKAESGFVSIIQKDQK